MVDEEFMWDDVAACLDDVEAARSPEHPGSAEFSSGDSPEVPAARPAARRKRGRKTASQVASAGERLTIKRERERNRRQVMAQRFTRLSAQLDALDLESGRNAAAELAVDPEAEKRRSEHTEVLLRASEALVGMRKEINALRAAAEGPQPSTKRRLSSAPPQSPQAQAMPSHPHHQQAVQMVMMPMMVPGADGAAPQYMQVPMQMAMAPAPSSGHASMMKPMQMMPQMQPMMQPQMMMMAPPATTSAPVRAPSPGITASLGDIEYAPCA